MTRFVSRFYGGGPRELQILKRAYERLAGHAGAIGKIRTAYEWTEDYVVKYMWSAAGYCLIGFPVLATVSALVDKTVSVQDEP